MNLTDEYPLRVQYPFFGPHHLLLWWCEWEQNKAIIARNEQDLLMTWKQLFMEERNEPERIQSYWVGNIVAPPEGTEETYARALYEYELHSFKYWVQHKAKSYLVTRGEPPPGFIRCDEYEPNEDFIDLDEEDEGALAYFEQEHTYCRKCEGERVYIPNPNWEALHRELITEFRADSSFYDSFPEGGRIIPPGTPRASNPDRLYVAFLEAGHHCKGFILRRWNKVDQRDWSLRPALFFFEGESRPVPGRVSSFLDNWYSCLEQKKEEAKATRKAQWQETREADAKETERLFARLQKAGLAPTNSE